jgi:hypothetical protein
MYITPNCKAPVKNSFQKNGLPTLRKRKNGKKTSNEKAIRAKETKFESTPARFPLMSPNENPQANETSNNQAISTSKNKDPVRSYFTGSLNLFPV